MDFLFFFGFSIFRLVRFRFLIRRSWVTSGGPPFLLFLVDFLFLVGFLCPVFLVLVGFLFLFPFFLSVFYFLIGAFLFFPKEWKTNFGAATMAATPISVFC